MLINKALPSSSKVARRSFSWANEKVMKLCEYAQMAQSIGLPAVALEAKIRIQIQTIDAIQTSMANIETAIKQHISSDAFPKLFLTSIELLDAMPGIGFISAVTLIAEIGDFSKFPSAKALTAFLGVDPNVNESGNFKGDRNRMSKRGSKLARRVLFTIAMASIRNTKKGTAINPILKNYYESKTKSKKKKVALVAVMHKLIHYIFAVLREQKNFVLRNPEIHRAIHMTNLKAVA